MPVWDSRLAKVFVQPDGPGNPFYFTDLETDMEALGGGSRSFQSDWGTKEAYVGSRKSSNPGDISGTITSRRFDVASRLRDLAESGCFFGILAANGCTSLDANDFASANYLTDAAFTARFNTSARLVDSTPGENVKVLDTLPFRAAKATEWRSLAAGRIATGPGVTTPIDVMAVGNKACAGCGVSNDGNKEFIAFTSSIAPSTVPRIAYTSDGGLTWKSCTLTGITTGVPSGKIVKIGDSILLAVTSTSGGCWRVSYNTLKDPATTTAIAATAATGITVGTNVRDLVAAGNTVLACGDTGQVWISRDKGFSFTQLVHGLTVANLFKSAAWDENLVYFGGPTTQLLKYESGVFSLITAATTINSASHALAVAPRSPLEIYMTGTSGSGATLFRSRDGGTTWETLIYDLSGGPIVKIQFVGDRGELMFFGSTTGNLFVDRSGGACASAVRRVRAATGSQGTIYAMSSPNYGIMAVTDNVNPQWFERISG